ncbi:hypothetical protein J3458_008745 [Metarhizium acridum]|uniref:uncharacterized protein n=1 Tax=Metarhizium acridum TaxID=92637 RepID=UPI001C6CE2A0|nr:hypothetical protein J3458_008745 [Metarhizium acridum]
MAEAGVRRHGEPVSVSLDSLCRSPGQHNRGTWCLVVARLEELGEAAKGGCVDVLPRIHFFFGAVSKQGLATSLEGGFRVRPDNQIRKPLADCAAVVREAAFIGSDYKGDWGRGRDSAGLVRIAATI